MRQFVVIHKCDGGWFAVIAMGGRLKVTPVVLDRQYLTDWLSIRQSENP